jgi:antitoxin ParD1/3/4
MGVGSRHWITSFVKSSNLAYLAVISLEHPPMAKVEKISVAVTTEMAIMLKEVVGSGAYASTSELMREALREWCERREYRVKASERLCQLWDEGLASGEATDGPTAMARIQTKLTKASANQTAA